MTPLDKIKAEQSAKSYARNRYAESWMSKHTPTDVFRQSDRAFDEGWEKGAKWQASEMAEHLAAKDAELLATATRIAFYQNVIDTKESLISMLHAEIQHLSDSVDGWKGRATGQE